MSSLLHYQLHQPLFHRQPHELNPINRPPNQHHFKRIRGPSDKTNERPPSTAFAIDRESFSILYAAVPLSSFTASAHASTAASASSVSNPLICMYSREMVTVNVSSTSPTTSIQEYFASLVLSVELLVVPLWYLPLLLPFCTASRKNCSYFVYYLGVFFAGFWIFVLAVL